MKNTPLSRQSNLVVQEMDKELLIYDLSDNKAYCLNETSALVYQLSDGKRTVQEIADSMSIKLKTLVNEDFVLLALNELKRDGLIENSDELKNYFARITRRELINKVALVSMISLPLVVSLAAPRAAEAASIADFCASNPCMEGFGPPATSGPGCNPPVGCGGFGLVCCATPNGVCACTGAATCTGPVSMGQICS